MRRILLILLFVVSGCGYTPVAHKEVFINNSQPVATYSTSDAQRQYARDRGLPVLLTGRAAEYPADLDASQAGNGWVLLNIEVLSSGTVGDVQVVQQSNPAFNNAAIDAVRHWRFEPSEQTGRFVQRITIIGTRGDHLQPDATVTH